MSNPNLKAGPGRPKGLVNKVNRDIKEMIVQALDKAGGADYLLRQSKENPTAFMTLVGKVLPMQVNSEISGGLKISWERGDSGESSCYTLSAATTSVKDA